MTSDDQFTAFTCPLVLGIAWQYALFIPTIVDITICIISLTYRSVVQESNRIQILGLAILESDESQSQGPPRKISRAGTAVTTISPVMVKLNHAFA